MSMEHHLIGETGVVRWQLWTNRGFFDEHGRIVEYQAVGRDISEQKRSEEAIRQSDKQLRLFVLHSPAAVAMFDRDMKYIICSRRWLTDYKLGYEDVIGRSHYDVFPEIPERWKEIHSRCLAGAVETDDDDSFVRGDGSTDWLRWEVRPWHDVRGQIGGVMMFTEVITERKRAEEEHRQLVAQKHVAEVLQEVDRRKDEFLAMLAHELRNPLAPIVPAAEIMRMAGPTDGLHRLGARRDRAPGRRSSRAWSTICSTSRASRAARSGCDARRSTCGRSSRTRSRPAQTAARAAGTSSRSTLPDEPLPIVRRRARGSTQVIANLLNNAAKYTARGRPHRVARRAQGGGAIVVSVADNGDRHPGATCCRRVFDMFAQADAQRASARRAASASGWRWSSGWSRCTAARQARSEGPGRGSEIRRATAPGAGAAARDARRRRGATRGAARAAARARPGGRRQRRRGREPVAHAAHCRGTRSRWHTTGRRRSRPRSRCAPTSSCWTSACPSWTGWRSRGACGSVPGSPRPCWSPMTGFGQAEDRARTAAAGFDHHLTKPVDLQLLHNR